MPCLLSCRRVRVCPMYSVYGAAHGAAADLRQRPGKSNDLMITGTTWVGWITSPMSHVIEFAQLDAVDGDHRPLHAQVLFEYMSEQLANIAVDHQDQGIAGGGAGCPGHALRQFAQPGVVGIAVPAYAQRDRLVVRGVDALERGGDRCATASASKSPCWDSRGNTTGTLRVPAVRSRCPDGWSLPLICTRTARRRSRSRVCPGPGPSSSCGRCDPWKTPGRCFGERLGDVVAEQCTLAAEDVFGDRRQ